MIGYLCDKFSDCRFSRFGFIVRTNTQNHTQTAMNALLPRLSSAWVIRGCVVASEQQKWNDQSEKKSILSHTIVLTGLHFHGLNSQKKWSRLPQNLVQIHFWDILLINGQTDKRRVSQYLNNFVGGNNNAVALNQITSSSATVRRKQLANDTTSENYRGAAANRHTSEFRQNCLVSCQQTQVWVVGAAADAERKLCIDDDDYAVIMREWRMLQQLQDVPCPTTMSM